jgi:hypothetical protein
MIDQSREDLWKKAYRKEFGTDPDEDMAEHGDDVEQWRQNWQAGYDAGEEWARSMVDEAAA